MANAVRKRFGVSIPAGICAALLLTIALAALVPREAAAHAGLESSVPAHNDILTETPEQVDLFFDGEVVKKEGLTFVRVYDLADEQQVSEGDGTVDDDDRTHVFATLPPVLPDGQYIVHWTATSDEDNETVSGVFCFYINLEPTTESNDTCGEVGGRLLAAVDEALSEEGEPEPAAAEPDDGGTSTGVIIGFVVGGVVVTLIVLGAATVVLRRRTR